MLHPSYIDLISVVGSDIKSGEQPVVQSRYSVVIAAPRRTRQLIAGEGPMVAEVVGRKPLSIAINELYHQKAKILPEEETMEEEKQNAQIISHLLHGGILGHFWCYPGRDDLNVHQELFSYGEYKVVLRIPGM